MKPHRLLLVALSITITQVFVAPPPASAVPYDNNPKILLHLLPTTAKNQCQVATLADCRDAVTEGITGQPCFAYVLAARGSMASVAGIQFGIQYETGCPADRDNGDRIDIFGWTLCATLEFIMPTPTWMAPGSGNLIIWDAVNRCQTGEVGVAGYFYLTCYSGDDVLEIVPRPVDRLAKLADCSSVETILPTPALGKAAFSVGGSTTGCNPCEGPCVPSTVPGCTAPPDLIPPHPAGNLSVIATTSTSITIRWTNTGDDGFDGQATALDIRYSTEHLDESNYIYAIVVTPPTLPAAPGVSQQRTITGLASNTTYFIRMKVVDEQQNHSDLSDLVIGTTGTPPLPDVTPPGTITTLSVIAQTSSTLTLRWTVPGDDGAGGGAATAYDIRYSEAPIDDGTFGMATPVSPPPGAPAVPGTLQTQLMSGLAGNTPYYMAMKTRDEVPNVSALSNVAIGTTQVQVADSTPPGAVNDLLVVSAANTGVTLYWTAPGDDGFTGTASIYDIRYSSTPITAATFSAATQAVSEPTPGPAHTSQIVTILALEPNITWYFALKSADEIPNISEISNVVHAVVPSVPADRNAETSLLLHVAPVTQNACGGLALADCDDVSTRGGLLPGPSIVYLLAGTFVELAGLECGITYDDGQPSGLDDQDQLDIHSWHLCADLEFPNPVPAWPSPGSGNLITWDAVNHCQVGEIAVAGYFYVGAYGPDVMRLTLRPSNGQARVATCVAAETVLPENALGWAVFSADASVEGYNPCDRGSAVSAIPTSWSRIKVLAGSAATGSVQKP